MCCLLILKVDCAESQVDPENLEKELTEVSFGLTGVVKELEACHRAGKFSVVDQDGDEDFDVDDVRIIGRRLMGEDQINESTRKKSTLWAIFPLGVG